MTKSVYNKRVFNFSMGETSAYMTIRYYRPGDLVVCCDTTREDPKSYKFLHDFEAHEGIPVHKLQLPGGWQRFLEKWGHGKKIPNRGMRECTLELKVRTARRYVRELVGMRYENFIGFRWDEKHRVDAHEEKWQQVTTRFPLYANMVTKEDINKFWENKPYRLEIPRILGNCDLCFMKGPDAIIKILTNYPERADRWIADEEDSRNIYGHTYVKGFKMSELKEKALVLISSGKIYPLEQVTPQMNCVCTA